MSELEFEKICRGNDNQPLNGEYAWGTLNCINAKGVNGAESDREHITCIGATAISGKKNFQGQYPLNAGIFCGAGKTREQTGAAFYGVMEMSSNLHDLCISIGNRYGRVFTYRNGNGKLSTDGFADENSWPLRMEKVPATEGEILQLIRSMGQFQSELIIQLRSTGLIVIYHGVFGALELYWINNNTMN